MLSEIALPLTRTLTSPIALAPLEPLTPLSIPGNGLWLDAFDFVGVVSDQDPIPTITDKSPLGNNATQGTVGFQAKFQASGVINGRPALRFDGVDDFYNANGAASISTAPHTLMIVYRTIGFAAIERLLRFTFGGIGRIGYFLDSTAIKQTDTVSHNLILGNRARQNTVLSVVYPKPDNMVYPYFNGALGVVQGLPLAASANQFFIGQLGGGFLSGDIGELILWTRALTDPERVAQEQRLFDKWL